jgi:hypothetical protein
MDFSNIDLFFNLYFQLPPEMAATTLSCLVQLSAVRRSFFNNNERMKYLNELGNGVKKILETSSVRVCDFSKAFIFNLKNKVSKYFCVRVWTIRNAITSSVASWHASNAITSSMSS